MRELMIARIKEIEKHYGDYSHIDPTKLGDMELLEHFEQTMALFYV